MSLEEAILDRVRRLSEAEQEQVLRFAERLRSRRAVRRVPIADLSRELEWIAENRAAYAGQWVAVEGDRLVAADEDAQKVFDAARAEGIETPFVVHIVAKDPLPFVPGW